METIRLKKAFPGHYEGQVISVDPKSAKALIDRGDAESVPEDAAAEPADTADEGSASAVVLTRQSPKAELVAFAVANGWGQEQAEGSTRAQIADAFGLE